MKQHCIFDFGGFVKNLEIDFYYNSTPTEYNFPNTDWLFHTRILPFKLSHQLTKEYGVPYYEVNRQKIRHMLKAAEKRRQEELEEYF